VLTETKIKLLAVRRAKNASVLPVLKTLFYCNSLGLDDSLVDLGGEEEVFAAAASDDLLKTRLVDWELKVGRVPSVDTGLVEVDDGDLDVWAVREVEQCIRDLGGSGRPEVVSRENLPLVGAVEKVGIRGVGSA
jgi:hypothetical protein